MKKKQMCVDFHAYLSGVTHMRQEFTVCQIKSHFSIVCRFSLFSLVFLVLAGNSFFGVTYVHSVQYSCAVVFLKNDYLVSLF